MHKIILIGGGGHCKSSIDVIEQEGRFDIAGVVEQPGNTEGGSILGYPILGTDDDLSELRTQTVQIRDHHARSNYWLNAVIMPDRQTRNEFLKATNQAGVVTRPAWRLLNKLEMYRECWTDALENANWLEDRVVNIPSSVRVGAGDSDRCMVWRSGGVLDA